MNPQIKFPEKLGYLFNGMTMSILGYVTGIYLMYYFTDIFGLAAGAAGTVLLAGRIWDGINDVLVGLVVDNVHSKHGKLRPYLLWFAIPTGLAFWVMFANPSLSPAMKVWYAFLTYFVYDGLFTFAAVSGNLIMRATNKNHERVTLTIFGAGGNSITNLALPLVFYPLALALGGGEFGRGFSPIVAMLAVLIVVFLMFQFFTSKERVVPADEQVAKEKVSLGEALSYLFHNRPWIIVQLASFTTSLALYFITAILPYYLKYILKNEGGMYLVMLPFAGVQILFYFAIPGIATKLGKRNAMLAALGFAILSRLICMLAPTNMINLAVTSGMLGISIAFSNLYATMIADTVDFGEWKRGKRLEGMTAAVGGFFIKLAMAGAAGAIGWLLQVNGYDGNLATQPASATNAIFNTIIYMPILVFAISIGIMFFYDLEKQLPQIHAEMEQRRAQHTSSQPRITDEPEPGLTPRPYSQ